MNKIKKVFLTMLIACLAVCMSVFMLVACGDDPSTPSGKGEAKLKSIAVTKDPTKVVYVSGSEFDPTGMEVTAYYDNNKSKVLGATDYTYSAPNMLLAPDQFEATKQVEIAYTEKLIEKITTLTITITNKVTGVEILTRPDKTEYLLEEMFDPTGLTVNVTLEDGTKNEVEITTINAQMSVEVIHEVIDKVTVTYGGFDFDVDISVTDPDAGKTVRVDSVDIDPEVKFENNAGNPLIVIGGGTYTATVDGYDMTDADERIRAEIKIAEEIQKMYYFQAINNPISGIDNYDTVIDNTHAVSILANNTFEVLCNISALTTGGIYGVRFVDKSTLGEEPTDNDYDFNSTHFPTFTALEMKSMIIGTTRYDAFYNDDNSGHKFDWDCLAIAVTETVPSFTDKAVTLERDGGNGKVYLAVHGEYKYYSKDELETELAKINGDYRYDQQLGNAENKDVAFDADAVIITVFEGEYGGTYEVKIELPDLTVGTAFFHLDYEQVEEKTNLKLPLKYGEVTIEDEENNLRFTLFITANTGTSWGWADGLVAIKIVDTSVKEYGKVDPAAIQQDGESVYLVLTGDCSGYTAQEIKGLITSLDFEPSHGDKTPIVADPEDIIVTIANGKYVIKYDLTKLNVVYDDGGNFGGYWVHLKPFGADDQPDDGAGNIGNDNGTTPVKVGGITYAYEEYDFGWGKRYILQIKSVKIFAAEKAEFEIDGESIYYVATFATENYTLDELKTKLFKIDLESTAGGRTEYEGEALIFGTLGEDGKLTVKIDVTTVGAGVYVPHYFIDGNNIGNNICDNAAVEAVTFDGKVYEVKETTVAHWGNWTAHLINISEASA